MTGMLAVAVVVVVEEDSEDVLPRAEAVQPSRAEHNIVVVTVGRGE
jgi:hypothetical protein